MTMLQTFTSTGIKLLRHGALLESWKKGVPISQSLQVAPTEKCTLRCKFCSVGNRSKKFELSLMDLITATKNFIKLGTKTVEITGGGDPLCYRDLNLYLSFLITSKMKVGIITNGIGINRLIDKELLKQITWIRISANVFDYKGQIEIPEGFEGTLGFSYVWTGGISTLKGLDTIRSIALENKVKYVRLVPNCIATKEEQKMNNLKLSVIAKKVGLPVFFQRKEFEIPPNCYWGYLKPFLYSDGYVYPCSSTVLNPDADKQFHSIYRWCHWKDIESVWKGSVVSLVDTQRCFHCVFCEQNKMLDYALNEQEHEEFI